MKLLPLLAILCLASCSTFYGPDGKPTARIMGDYTHTRAADGSETTTLNHSSITPGIGGAVAATLVALP